MDIDRDKITDKENPVMFWYQNLYTASLRQWKYTKSGISAYYRYIRSDRHFHLNMPDYYGILTVKYIIPKNTRCLFCGGGIDSPV